MSDFEKDDDQKYLDLLDTFPNLSATEAATLLERFQQAFYYDSAYENQIKDGEYFSANRSFQKDFESKCREKGQHPADVIITLLQRSSFVFTPLRLDAMLEFPLPYDDPKFVKFISQGVTSAQGLHIAYWVAHDQNAFQYYEKNKAAIRAERQRLEEEKKEEEERLRAFFKSGEIQDPAQCTPEKARDWLSQLYDKRNLVVWSCLIDDNVISDSNVRSPYELYELTCQLILTLVERAGFKAMGEKPADVDLRQFIYVDDPIFPYYEGRRFLETATWIVNDPNTKKCYEDLKGRFRSYQALVEELCDLAQESLEKWENLGVESLEPHEMAMLLMLSTQNLDATHEIKEQFLKGFYPETFLTFAWNTVHYVAGKLKKLTSQSAGVHEFQEDFRIVNFWTDFRKKLPDNPDEKEIDIFLALENDFDFRDFPFRRFVRLVFTILRNPLHLERFKARLAAMKAANRAIDN